MDSPQMQRTHGYHSRSNFSAVQEVSDADSIRESPEKGCLVKVVDPLKGEVLAVCLKLGVDPSTFKIPELDSPVLRPFDSQRRQGPFGNMNYRCAERPVSFNALTSTVGN